MKWSHFIILLILVCLSLEVKATHILGGHISYECLGGDEYEFTLSVYSDCFGQQENPVPDNLIFFTPEGSCTGLTTIANLAILSSTQEISELCDEELLDSSCLPGGFSPGTILTTYTVTQTLDPSCTWIASWSFDDYNFLIHCSIEEEQIAKNLKISVDSEVTIRVIEPKRSILNMITNISICDVFIAGSTGPLHVAGALNKKTIGFYPKKKSSTSLRWETINNFENSIENNQSENVATNEEIINDIPSGVSIESASYMENNINAEESSNNISTTDDIIEDRQNKIAKERGYEIIDHSMVLYVKPIKK